MVVHRVVLMGTPEFAVPSLEALVRAGHDLLVVTQPARAAGRGRKLRASPVRLAAERLGVPTLERASLRGEDAVGPLQDFAPDFVVVVAFGLILRARVLALPRLMPINLHPSRLPHLRGVAPIPWTIWLGDRTTAVSTMHMDRGVDTGDVLLTEPVEVRPSETAGELGARMSALGAHLVVRTLEAVAGGLRGTPQPSTGATYAPKLAKEHGHLDWSRSAGELARQVRAVSPWPRARVVYDGAPVVLTRVEAEELPVREAPGGVIDVDRESIRVATGHGILRLLEMQPAGRQAMSGSAFARGRRVRPGCRFDSLPLPDELPRPEPISGERAG